MNDGKEWNGIGESGMEWNGTEQNREKNRLANGMEENRIGNKNEMKKPSREKQRSMAVKLT